MDNKSSVGGENFSGVPDGIEAMPDSFEQKFGPSELERRIEQRVFDGQAELGRGVLEATPSTDVLPEVGASAAELGYGDANAQATEINGRIIGTDLNTKKRAKHGDRLDPEIAKEVEVIEKEFDDDPSQGAIDFSKKREWYMEAILGRRVGERNDGSKHTALNMLNDKPGTPGENTQSQEQRKAA